MKKAIVALLLAFTICFGWTVVKADDLYYIPNKGDTYFKTQHLYSYYVEETLKQNYAAAIHTLIKDGTDTTNLESAADFSSLFNVPWTIDEQNYFLTFCADVSVRVEELLKYKMVPLEESQFVKTDAAGKNHITGILRHSWPFMDYDTVVKELVDAGVIVAKEVNGETYYTSPANANPTMSITKHELVLATQIAIYNYSNPGAVKDIYQTTKQANYRTVLTPTRPYDGPWDASLGEEGAPKVIEEAKNNVMAVYNYLKTLTETNEEFKIESVTIHDKDDKIFVTVKTNREVNNKDNINISIKEGTSQIGTYKLTDFVKEANNTYSLTIKGLKSGKVEVSYSGEEYARYKAYAFEAVDGQDTGQTFVSLASAHLPVSGKIEVVYVENPVTSSSISFMAIGIFVVSIITVVYMKKKKSFLK